MQQFNGFVMESHQNTVEATLRLAERGIETPIDGDFTTVYYAAQRSIK